MVIVLALLAALSNAVNEATQHVASTAAPRRQLAVVYLFGDRLWLFGWRPGWEHSCSRRWPCATA